MQRDETSIKKKHTILESNKAWRRISKEIRKKKRKKLII